MNYYSAFGLLIETPLDLLLAGATFGVGHQPDITLLPALPDAFSEARRQGEIVPRRDDEFQHVLLEDGGLYLAWENWIEMIVSADGRLVRFLAQSDAPQASLAAYLVNFAVSTALMLKGEETLHATAIKIGGAGVGLIGASGAGKSTLAALLISRGAELITDDILRLKFEGQSAAVHAGPDRLKLLDKTVGRFLPGLMNSGLFHPAEDKHLVVTQRTLKEREMIPLAALVYLDRTDEPPDGKPVNIRELHGLGRFPIIAASTMNSRLHAPWRLRQHLAFVERVAGIVPLHALTYLRQFEIIEQAAELIERLPAACQPDHLASQHE